jgi:hypothetical protein
MPWYCHKCTKTVPNDEVHFAAWNSPHGDEAHTICGSGHIDLIEPDPDTDPCSNRYQRPGGAQRGDRIVKCSLPACHLGDHEEEPGGNTWPATYTPDPDCACDGKCRWCAHMGCEACCDSYANGDHGVKDGA